MNRSNRFFQLAALMGLTGMALGVFMGARHDFSLAPVHAHINLLGWVSMSLYAVFYRLHPDAARSRLAAAHFWINLAGVLILVISLAMLLRGDLRFNPPLEAASAAVLASMALFVAIVFRATRATA